MTDAELEALFYRLRWPPNGDPICPRCGVGNPYRLAEYRRWRCSNSKCRSDFTLLSRTLLSAGKRTLRAYYIAIDTFANRTTWKCASEMGRRACMDPRACYVLAQKLFSLLSHEGERVSTEELLARVLRAKPQPERRKKSRPVTVWPLRLRV